MDDSFFLDFYYYSDPFCLKLSITFSHDRDRGRIAWSWPFLMHVGFYLLDDQNFSIPPLKVSSIYISPGELGVRLLGYPNVTTLISLIHIEIYPSLGLPNNSSPTLL